MLGGLRIERDDRAPPVLRILAAADEAVGLELGRQLAGRRKGDAERLGDLAHGLLAFDTDLRERADMSPAELRLAGNECEQLGGRTPAPEPAQHLPQRSAELRELGAAHRRNSCHPLTVIIR